MSDWSELERRFRALESPLKGARIDYQFDDKGGESFSLIGGPAPDRASFEALAAIAGRLLSTFPDDALPPEVLRPATDRDRWFRALWYMVGPHAQPATGFEHQGDALVRAISLAQISTPAAYSSALALKLQAVAFIPSAPISTRKPRLVEILEQERQKRGIVWIVAAAIATLVLAALAL